MNRWEYIFAPVNAKTTVGELNKLGAHGWELCVVADGIGWFKRDRTARELEGQGNRMAAGLFNLEPQTGSA